MSIDDVLPGDLALPIGAALAGLAWVRSAPDPRDLGGDEPGHLYYEAPLGPDGVCRSACSPACAMAASLGGGALLEFLRAVTGHPRLSALGVSARAYAKGSHDSQRDGVQAIWYGTRGWAAQDGGLLRFRTAEPWAPRFGALHVVEGACEVTLVQQHRPLQVIRGLYRARDDPHVRTLAVALLLHATLVGWAAVVAIGAGAPWIARSWPGRLAAGRCGRPPGGTRCRGPMVPPCARGRGWFLRSPFSSAAYLVKKRRLPRPRFAEVVVVCIGVAAGAFPTALIGRATAIALTNDDATFYLAAAERLLSHTWLEHPGDGQGAHSA